MLSKELLKVFLVLGFSFFPPSREGAGMGVAEPRQGTYFPVNNATIAASSALK